MSAGGVSTLNGKNMIRGDPSMSKKQWMRFIIGLALMVLVLGSNGLAQNVMTGDWTASLVHDNSGKINLNFERRNEKGGRKQMGQTYDFADLQA